MRSRDNKSRGVPYAWVLSWAGAAIALSACRTDSERSLAGTREPAPSTAEQTGRGDAGAVDKSDSQAQGTEPEPQRARSERAESSGAAENGATPRRDDKASDDGEKPRADTERASGSRAFGLSAATAADGRVRLTEVSGRAALVLKPGDIVVRANSLRVASATDFDRALDATGDSSLVLLEVVRDGRLRSVGVPRGETAPRAERTRAPAEAKPEPAAASRPVAPAAEGAAAARPVVIIVGGSPFTPSAVSPGWFVSGGGEFVGIPPAFAAPGVAQVPGATFAPPPGTPSWNTPVPAGMTQPPGWRGLPPLGRFVPPVVTAPIEANVPRPGAGAVPAASLGSRTSGGTGVGTATAPRMRSAPAGGAAIPRAPLAPMR